MAGQPGANEASGQGHLSVGSAVDAFYAGHPEWNAHTLECYRSVLEAFCRDFDQMPEHRRVVAWVTGLQHLFNAGPLKTGTRRDYYKRIQYLYRWTRDNDSRAKHLPDLPYESFASRKWKI